MHAGWWHALHSHAPCSIQVPSGPCLVLHPSRKQLASVSLPIAAGPSGVTAAGQSPAASGRRLLQSSGSTDIPLTVMLPSNYNLQQGIAALEQASGSGTGQLLQTANTK